MSTSGHETRFGGNCFRCGQSGHWADNPQCPWLTKAANKTEHHRRIAAILSRFWAWEISPHQKQQYISDENKLWYGGKCPPTLTR